MNTHTSGSTGRPEQPFLPQFGPFEGSFHFITDEERAVRGLNSFAPFWRLGDRLCARVLAEGANPRRFAWIKALFPLFREASLLQIPHPRATLHSWQPFAFFAGFEFGRTFPEKGAALLQGDQTSLAVLRRIRALLGAREANPWNLHQAFARYFRRSAIGAAGLGEAFVQQTTQTFGAGLAAATTAKSDPELTLFLAQIHPRSTEFRTQLHMRVLFQSCARAEGRPVVELLKHPLLKVAEQQYPHTPLEREAILPFFHGQLHAFGVRSENECPIDDLAVVDWVHQARSFGLAMCRGNPDRVKAVIAQLGPTRLEAVAGVTQAVLDRTKSRRALDLTRAILDWHEKVHRWRKPWYYGQALDRVVHCADFAIWTAWIEMRAH